MQIDSLVVGQPTPFPNMVCILAPDWGISKRAGKYDRIFLK